MSDPTPPGPAPEALLSTTQPEVSDSPSSSNARPEYEFNAAENEVLNSLTRGMMWVRLPLFIVGLFQLIIAVGLAFRLHRDGAHIIGIMGHALAAVVCFLLANLLLKAAKAFVRVTTTSGHDITNLMTGIRNLAVWFDMLAFFVKLYLLLLGIVLIIMLVGLFGGAFRGPS